MKAKREAEFPEIRRPKREIWIEPDIADIERFFNEHIVRGQLVSVDIETAGNQVTCIGFSPTSKIALVIPFVDKRRKGGNYWGTADLEGQAWRLVRGVLEDPHLRKTFQNGLYDIAFLLRSMGLKTMGATEDTMLCHHALQPESLKSLGFLGSVYTSEASWKGMRKTETIKADE